MKPICIRSSTSEVSMCQEGYKAQKKTFETMVYQFQEPRVQHHHSTTLADTANEVTNPCANIKEALPVLENGSPLNTHPV